MFPTTFPTQENIILSSDFPRISSDLLGPLGTDVFLHHLSIFTRDGLVVFNTQRFPLLSPPSDV
jgi:hypothetical protein